MRVKPRFTKLLKKQREAFINHIEHNKRNWTRYEATEEERIVDLNFPLFISDTFKMDSLRKELIIGDGIINFKKKLSEVKL